MIRAFIALFLVSICVLGLPHPARANSTRPDIVGTTLGVFDVSAGTSWTSATSGSLRCAKTGTTCTSGLVFSQLILVNTHASQGLYFTLHSASSETTTSQLYVGPGSSLTLELYGQTITAVSFQGTGAATTGRLIGWLVPN